MKEKIRELIAKAENFKTAAADEIEQFRIQMLGKKGEINKLMADFRQVPGDQKRELGMELNRLKTTVQEKIEELKAMTAGKSADKESMDLSLPGDPLKLGTRHPVSVVRNEIVDIFARLGFTVSKGPEIEDDWHNFSALNFPPNHPARDMQDTFFVTEDQDVLLRTHTSSVQVRVMDNAVPPIRTISPGRVYRNEAISARSHCIFHQVEGLYIDKDVSFADLKQTLLYFVKEFYGEQTRIRLRPSYFPFTEPSAEMDASCNLCGGKGCRLCKYTGWIEIMGCGMVDPNVLKLNNIDPEIYSGFAFGMGVERTAMAKYQIDDIRLFFENDVRFLNQFQAPVR